MWRDCLPHSACQSDGHASEASACIDGVDLCPDERRRGSTAGLAAETATNFRSSIFSKYAVSKVSGGLQLLLFFQRCNEANRWAGFSRVWTVSAGGRVGGWVGGVCSETGVCVCVFIYFRFGLFHVNACSFLWWDSNKQRRTLLCMNV